MLKEFKPALWFVAKFLIVYFAGNTLYGVFVESYHTIADPVTTWVTDQSAIVLNVAGNNTETFPDTNYPKVHILTQNRKVLSVYEGCNGLNVMIVFLAFMVAYGGKWKNMILSSLLGIILIHLANITRIVALYYVAECYPNYMYFTHKYLFTGFIYAFVLVLWFLWATRFSK